MCAGSSWLQLYVCGPDDDVEALKEEVMEDMTDIFSSVDKTGGWGRDRSTG